MLIALPVSTMRSFRQRFCTLSAMHEYSNRHLQNRPLTVATGNGFHLQHKSTSLPVNKGTQAESSRALNACRLIAWPTIASQKPPTGHSVVSFGFPALALSMLMEEWAGTADVSVAGCECCPGGWQVFELELHVSLGRRSITDVTGHSIF